MGGDVPLDKLDAISEATGQALTIRIGEDAKPGWPEWARILNEKMDTLLNDPPPRGPSDPFDVKEEHRPAEAER